MPSGTSFGFCLTDATSNAARLAFWACSAAARAATAKMPPTNLRKGAGGFAGVVSNDDVGAGAADGRQALEHRALLVEPAVARRGLEHRVLAADVVRRRRISEFHLHARQDIEVWQRRLDHH